MTSPDVNVSTATRLARFSVVGGACFLLSWSLLWIGTDVFGWPYLVSTAAAFSAVALFGHRSNREFTFSATDQAYFPQLRRYVVTTVTSLALSLLLMWLLVDLGGIHYLLANVCVAVVIALLNFSANKIWVFSEPRINQ